MSEVKEEKRTVEESMTEFCKNFITMLVEKNKRYGNSALAPISVFYKGSPASSILCRLNDKYSRICQANEPYENDLYDIFGYLVLYTIAMDYLPATGENPSFEAKTKAVMGPVFKEAKQLIGDGISFNAFSKADNDMYEIDRTIQIVAAREDNSDVAVEHILFILKHLMHYFAVHDCTDPNKFID